MTQAMNFRLRGSKPDNFRKVNNFFIIISPSCKKRSDRGFGSEIWVQRFWNFVHSNKACLIVTVTEQFSHIGFRNLLKR